MVARLLALAALFAPSVAAAGPVVLAETDLRDAKDWDMVRLPPCAASGNVVVTRLGVAVTRHPAQIDRLVVTFQDGQKQELTVRNRFEPGSESRWIDLDGPARCIASIRIVGDANTLGWRPRAQAHVIFSGLHPEGDHPVMEAMRDDHPAMAPDADVFTRLGAVRLTDRKDWDMLRFPECRGSENIPITHLRVKVNDFPAEIDKLKVTYQNGDQQELAVRERFEPGTTSRWIDLEGPARCLASVRIVGDTNSLGWAPGKQAEVVFQGRN